MWPTPLGVRPLAPKNVAATNGTYYTQTRITWTAAVGATAYDVYRNTTDSAGTAVKLNPADILTTTFDDRTGEVQRVYYYWVKAKNAYGEGPFSSSNSGYRKFMVVTGVSASDGTYSDRVRVTWTVPVEGATGYNIYRDTTSTFPTGALPLNPTPVSGPPYDDFTAVLNQKYYYWVKAVNAYGASGKSSNNTGYAAIPPPPAPVAYPAWTSTGSYTVSCGSVSGTTAYVFERSADGGTTWTQVRSGTATSFTDSVPNGSYRYRAKAIKGSAVSPWAMGDHDCVVYKNLVAPSTVQAVRPGTSALVYVSWKDTNTGEDGYVVEWKPPGATSYTEVTRVTANMQSAPPVTVVSGTTSFRVRAYKGAVLGPTSSTVSVTY